MEYSKDLSSLNSFGLAVSTAKYYAIHQLNDLQNVVAENNEEEILVLGGGSNILFTRDFPGTILHNRISGVEVVSEDASTVKIKVGGGENWHKLVLSCIGKNWGGIENLSLIPGSVGAAPIQNIGAYGVELKDVFDSLDFYDFEKDKLVRLSYADCQFGYRDSIFKRDLRGRGMIIWVYLTLSKEPKINIEYGAIHSILDSRGIKEPSIRDVSEAVISIRESKLPNPDEIGNAGSFFKNPVITKAKYEEIKKEYPDMPGYPNGEDIKVPAGWLIDKAGWKGYRRGSIGVHKDQALVLVNHGGGSGKELEILSVDIKESIFKNFGIPLETEVNIL